MGPRSLKAEKTIPNLDKRVTIKLENKDERQETKTIVPSGVAKLLDRLIPSTDRGDPY